MVTRRNRERLAILDVLIDDQAPGDPHLLATVEERHEDRLRAPHVDSNIPQRLRISKATVYRLVAEGMLPHVRIGNAIRFLP
jgi:predicted DNA-binding transcriptional regulator AlpA